MKEEILKIAITGGIGSGKSTVAEYLREKGFPVFSCDEIYKEIYPTEEYQSELQQVFPDCLIDGKIEKSLLAAKVFSNAEELKKLNAIAHSRIMSELYNRINGATSGVVFAEIPLFAAAYDFMSFAAN